MRLQFPQESNCNVPKWLIQSVFCGFPSGATVMFPASKIVNDPGRCTRNVPEWHIQNFSTILSPFSKFPGNCGETANTSQRNRKTGKILNVFAVSPQFPRNLPKGGKMVGKF